MLLFGLSIGRMISNKIVFESAMFCDTGIKGERDYGKKGIVWGMPLSESGQTAYRRGGLMDAESDG